MICAVNPSEDMLWLVIHSPNEGNEWLNLPQACLAFVSKHYSLWTLSISIWNILFVFNLVHMHFALTQLLCWNTKYFARSTSKNTDLERQINPCLHKLLVQKVQLCFLPMLGKCPIWRNSRATKLNGQIVCSEQSQCSHNSSSARCELSPLITIIGK